jgi:hypothetical protein
MSDVGTRDYFDTARSYAAAVLFAAGAAAILGSFLDWVTIEPPDVVPVEQLPQLEPFNGIEATDGQLVIGAAAFVILCALMLILRRRALWAWGAFLASMLIGGIAVADYRGIDQIFYDEMNRIGDPAPALGLTLVAAAGFIGLIAAAAGVAATPRMEERSAEGSEEP